MRRLFTPRARDFGLGRHAHLGRRRRRQRLGDRGELVERHRARHERPSPACAVDGSHPTRLQPDRWRRAVQRNAKRHDGRRAWADADDRHRQDQRQWQRLPDRRSRMRCRHRRIKHLGAADHMGLEAESLRRRLGSGRRPQRHLHRRLQRRHRHRRHLGHRGLAHPAMLHRRDRRQLHGLLQRDDLRRQDPVGGEHRPRLPDGLLRQPRHLLRPRQHRGGGQ